jgi:hypothetical protein
MKKIKTTLGIVAMSFAILAAQSCGNQEEKNTEPMMEHDNSDGHHDHESHTGEEQGAEDHANVTKTEKSELLTDYLGLKNALTMDDETKASEIAGKMVETIKGFDVSSYTEGEQSEIKDILETSLEHAEHIAKSPIAHQREHFKALSTDMIDLVVITGTDTKLYQQYCPMYDKNKGGSWLSTESTVKNPYYGSKMLSCGKVEKEYN